MGAKMVAWLSIRHKGSSCSSVAERAREGKGGQQRAQRVGHLRLTVVE